MYCEEALGTFNCGGFYSSGTRFLPVFSMDNYHFNIFEAYGIISIRKVSNKGVYLNNQDFRLLSSWDLQVFKSVVLNNNGEVDWENYNIVYKLLSEVEMKGFPLVQDTDYCQRKKIKPFINL